MCRRWQIFLLVEKEMAAKSTLPLFFGSSSLTQVLWRRNELLNFSLQPVQFCYELY